MKYWKPKLYQDVPYARNILPGANIPLKAIQTRPLFSDAGAPESYEVPASRLDEVGSVEQVRPTDKSRGGTG